MEDRTFNFDAKDLQSYLMLKLDLADNVKEGFNYVVETLIKMKFYYDFSKSKQIDLEKLNWYESKNYNWSVLKKDKILILFRQYGLHYTIYVRKQGNQFYDVNDVSAFTYWSNIEKLDDKMYDSYIDEPLKDLNGSIGDILKLIEEDNIWSVWNNLSLKRPDHCEVKLAFNGKSISSYDSLVFAAEELHIINTELFAKNEMLDAIKKLKGKEGIDFNYQYTIKEVKTDLEDNYYHGVGLVLKDKKGKKEDWRDVFSLTHWYLKDIMNLVDKK